jgi:hypothetical protein
MYLSHHNFEIDHWLLNVYQIHQKTATHLQYVNLINVIYVVKDLVRMVAYRDTLEHIQVIHLINVIYVVKDLV